MHTTSFIIGATSVLVALACLVSAEDSDSQSKEIGKVEEEKLEYAKGSLCKYCEYCKFCKLCDQDCPCETTSSLPNCKMCKYCKFCYVCKACNAVCTAGGYMDTVSAAIVNALPTSLDTDEVEGDIDSVREWISKKEEL